MTLYSFKLSFRLRTLSGLDLRIESFFLNGGNEDTFRLRFGLQYFDLR